MVRIINFPVEDELYKKIAKLKEEKRWTWEDFVKESYKKLSENYEQNNND